MLSTAGVAFGSWSASPWVNENADGFVGRRERDDVDDSGQTMRYLGLLILPVLCFLLLDGSAWAKRSRGVQTEQSVEEHVVRWDVDGLEVRLQGVWMLDYRATLELYPARDQRARRLAISEKILGMEFSRERGLARTQASVLGGSSTDHFIYDVVRIEGESLILQLTDPSGAPMQTMRLSFLDNQRIQLEPERGAENENTLIFVRAETGELESAIRSATLWQYAE